MLASASSSRLRSCALPLAQSPRWRPAYERCMATGMATRSVSSHPDETRLHLSKFFPKQSQSQTFTNDPSSQFRITRSPASQAARLKMQLANCAETGDAARAFRICAEMKQLGTLPDITAYNWILHAAAKQGLGDECFALLDDMRALGLKPNQESYNHVLYAQRWNRNFVAEEFLEEMENRGIPPNTNTFHQLIRRHVETQNLEMCLQCFADMNARGISPALNTMQNVIELATLLGHARLALDIAYAYEATSVRKLEGQDWIRILQASTACHFENGVLDGWHKAVVELGVIPGEGLCIETLHTAARYGLVELAVHALQLLHSSQVHLEEYHYSPVLEAYCHHGMIEDSFTLLNLMQGLNVEVTPEMMLPLVNHLNKDIVNLDSAWAIVEKMRQAGKSMHIHVLNILIRAAVDLKDLQRAIGIYKALPEFNLKPITATFNTLLSGCVTAKHRDLGDRLLLELRELDLVPDKTTFEKMILLCLTQSVYEDAFFYLEEMKGQGFTPPLSVYEAIIITCSNNQDVRYKIALEEVKECGYTLSQRLVSVVSVTGGNKFGGSTKTRELAKDIDDP